MTTSHVQQVASVLQRSVQELLTRGLNDPRVRGLISVTRVAVAPDLAQATIFVSILPEQHERTTMRGLESAAPFIQAQIGKRVRLRRLPKLVFELDASLKNQARIHAAIQEGAERSGLRSPVAPALNENSPSDPSPLEESNS